MTDRAASPVLGNGFDGHFAGFREVPWGIPLGLEGLRGRYEADSNAERPAAGQSAMNAGPEAVHTPGLPPWRRSCCRAGRELDPQPCCAAGRGSVLPDILRCSCRFQKFWPEFFWKFWPV